MDSKNKLIHSTFWSLCARLISVFIKAFAVVYLARLLGPDEYGIFTTVVATTSFLAIFCDFGISPSAAKFISENKYNNKTIIGKASLLIFGAFLILVSCLYLFSNQIFALLNLSDIDDLVLIIVLLLIFEIFKRLFIKVFEGFKRVDISSRILLFIEWTIWGLAIAAVLYEAHEAGTALLGRALGLCLIVIGLAFALKKYLFTKYEDIGKKKFSFLKLVTYGLPLLLTAISTYIYSRSDILLIQAFLGERQVGLYGVAIQLLDVLHVPAVAIGSAVAASFVSFKKEGKKKAQTLFLKVTKWLLIIYLPLGFGLLLTAENLIPLIFGSEYSASVIIAMMYMPFLVTDGIATTYSLGLDYLGYAPKRALAILASASANILLNLYMIPNYGITGAALTTQVTYIPLVIWYLYMLADDLSVELMDLLKEISSIFVATTLMISILFIVQVYLDFHVLLIIFLGVLIYTSLSFLLGVITRREIKKIYSLIKKD